MSSNILTDLSPGLLLRQPQEAKEERTAMRNKSNNRYRINSISHLPMGPGVIQTLTDSRYALLIMLLVTLLISLLSTDVTVCAY